MLRIALFEPDIPQNVGAIFRLAACFGVGVDIIEPCGFIWSDRHIKRVAMDYESHVESIVRHSDWRCFYDFCERESRRLVLLTTRGSDYHYAANFGARDILLFGRESSGVPDFVHGSVALRVRIPMAEGARSLNIATAAAIVLSEAVRQIGYGDLN